ncbi:MAG: fused MFS/spermidine synthase [Thioploca sp.]|nr:fused MFS/spermidine synthase [Thioploca sp.]
MQQLQISNQIIRRLYFIFFALSGFSGLIYESIWTHYLKLFLGHAAYAQTLVLIIFMGGMACGAWAASRYSLKLRNLLLGYAIVEGIIGLLALGFHPLFIRAIDFAYLTAIPQLTSTTSVSLFKWSLSALLILPQSILLGTTFPLMSAGIIRRFPTMPGYSLAILYFTNSLGAAIGVLVSGFFLIEAVGLPGTILTAGLINLLIALLVWLLCHNDNLENLPNQFIPNDSAQRLSQPVFIALLLCAALTGIASFLYEIGWIRMLSLVLSSSTHAFELMLSAFILGLAIGGYWIRRRIDSLFDLIKTLGWIQVIMGMLALSTLVSYGQSFEWMSYTITALTKTAPGYTLFNISSHGIALIIMLPATICAGMTLPLLTYYLISKGYGEKSIGSIYAANTLGAIIGVIAGVQLIMPNWGVKNLITIGGGIDILLGLILLWYAGSNFSKLRWIANVSVSGMVLLVSVVWGQLDPIKMSSGVYHYGRISYDRKVLFHKDGKTASVDLTGTADESILTISTNGKPDASIGKDKPTPDEPTMRLSAALPWSIHNKAKTAAVIGFGAGITSHTLLSIPSIERVDTIEIEPAMVEGAKGFGERNINVYSDPRSHIHIEDAKAYFTNYQKKYDLIISEPSNPWVSGVSGLFSQEFYQLIRHQLSEKGLFLQWFHIYQLNMDLVASIIKAISSQFADYTLYFSSPGDILVVATQEDKLNEPTQAIFEIPEIAKELAYIGIKNQQDLLLHQLGSKAVLDPLFNSYPIAANSDYFPLLDLGAVRAHYLTTTASELTDLHLVTVPLMDILENKPIRTEPLILNENLYIQAAAKAKQALAIYHYFQGIKTGQLPSPTSMEGETLAVIRNVRSLHQQQCPPTHPDWFKFEIEESWLFYLRTLADITLPYLSPQEMDVIWNDIESASCFAQLPQTIQQWTNLYKAISQRNFEQILQFANELLPQANSIADSKANDYLLMVAMLAHIALQDYNSAMVLFGRYTQGTILPVELRLLAAIASQKGL